MTRDEPRKRERAKGGWWQGRRALSQTAQQSLRVSVGAPSSTISISWPVPSPFKLIVKKLRDFSTGSLAQLKRGRKTWNQWRQEHPEIRPDLSEIVVAPYGVDMTLDGYDLRDIVFKGADLAGVTFSQTQSQRADFSNTNLHSARFWEVDLTGACLRNAVIQFAVFASVQLKDADLTGTDGGIAELDGKSDGPPSGLSGPFYAADLRQATLSYANFESARLDGVNLEEAILLGTALNFAYLDQAHLRQANLQNTQLVGVKLQGADLRGANLQGAIFNLNNPNWNGFQDVGNPLRGFSNADLKGTDLRGVDLRGADLIGVDLSEAFWRGQSFDLR